MKKTYMVGGIAVFLCIAGIAGCSQWKKAAQKAADSGIVSDGTKITTKRENKDGCTTGASGKNANIYGAAMTWHTNDNELSDQSLYYTPAMDYDLKKNPWRNVYIDAVALNEYPVWHSYLTPVLNLDAAERGPDYDYGAQYPRNISAGQIPQLRSGSGCIRR